MTQACCVDARAEVVEWTCVGN